MLSTLYLLKYNNYYNRVLKKKDSLTDYLEFQIGEAIQGVNFNPNDGVWAKQVINWNNDIPDYLLVVDGTKTIVSRWFVIESRRLLSGQFEIELFRDSLADYYEDILSAPMFLEKGYCSINDSAIFNDEQISVNQIKKDEFFLKDNTEVGWIVGYCAPPKDDEEATEIVYGINTGFDFYSPTLQDWDFYSYVNKTYKVLKDYNYYMPVKHSTGYGQVKREDFKFKEGQFISMNTSTGDTSSAGYIGDYLFYTASYTATLDDKIKEQCVPLLPSNMYNLMLTNFNLTEETNAELVALYNLDGKVIKIGDTRYGIELEKTIHEGNVGLPVNESSYHYAWRDYAKSFVNYNNQQLFDNTDFLYKAKESYKTEYSYTSIKLVLKDLTSVSGLSFSFPGSTRKILKDAPYCMFTLPYGNLDILYNKGNEVEAYETTAENGLSVAMGIATSLGSKLYDLQLLPYCPINAIRENTKSRIIDLRKPIYSDWEENKDYVVVPGAHTLLFFADTSSGTFDIVAPTGLYTYSDAITFKAWMLSTQIRLCSPNYNGVFEINPYKNRGINYLNVDYTYKPFQPYIHINPNFNGLYGKDFDDARGLICGGDFSLPITNDAWINYQINNKTYQEQFNRQIENMEVQHKYGRIQDIVKAATGTVGGATSGGMTGFMAGGPYGAAAGAIIGGVASGAGGIADIKINEALRNEAMDYTKDLFGLQLDNIQALPNSLTRVSSLNFNNKIFPFIEYYHCTEEEFTAIANKLKYNGFTIGRIQTLKDAIDNKPLYMGLGYFKGQLIRLETINDDFHIVNIIASELNKGVYI